MADEENIGRIGRCPKCKKDFGIALSLVRHALEETNSPPNLYPDLLRTDSISRKQVWFEPYDLGANYHRQLTLLTHTDFLVLTFEERRRAFTVPGVNDLNTVRAIHKLILLDFESDHGTDFRTFLSRVKEFFAGPLPSPITEAALEKVYRRNIMTMYSRGQEQLVENYGWNLDAFPYRQLDAVHDDRTPPSHLALEHAGLNGTGIYRWDDPFFQCCQAPITDMCRCGTTVLSIRHAAEKGVKEAQQWLLSGIPPKTPQWVKWPDLDPRWELEDEEFDEHDIPDLIRQVQHNDPVIRAGVFWALGTATSCCELDDAALAERLVSILNAALHDPILFIRKAATEALANLAESRLESEKRTLESQNRAAEVQGAIGMLCDADRVKRVAAGQPLP